MPELKSVIRKGQLWVHSDAMGAFFVQTFKNPDEISNVNPLALAEERSLFDGEMKIFYQGATFLILDEPNPFGNIYQHSNWAKAIAELVEQGDSFYSIKVLVSNPSVVVADLPVSCKPEVLHIIVNKSLFFDNLKQC